MEDQILGGIDTHCAEKESSNPDVGDGPTDLPAAKNQSSVKVEDSNGLFCNI